jgi:hypothetical protein
MSVHVCIMFIASHAAENVCVCVCACLSACV